MIDVLICDDHWIVRQGLKQTLEDAPDMRVAGEVPDGPSCVARVREGGVDVVLLDIAMPGRDGLDVLRQLKGEHPRLPVLMLSTYPERHYAVRCLKLGAAGYLNKSADPEALLAAIRKAASGGVYVTPSIAEALATSLSDTAGKQVHEILSHREYQVFRLIAQGCSVSQIAEQLHLSPNTVSTYRARILEKTGTRNDVEIALYAVQQDLMPV
ncbi:response regulator transcription factor [Caldimonas thermodepolymerans]|jgi:Response regulator containing a CheY-like receiver domain and an HTH DNA-binding domain|uniref:DNA-binding response regulator n=1 Tax=Caldimonas thermodepolymerans TaxID=215580 RepID=A0A2S5T457_9BURK|nr:response regulator transcription factor [Caldimonas thermodepolymerans]PPE69719.1 DNA-binding response regulator [Caldimonas thermodepolymerans]QPC31869.1 response regulator transcription factor [Caldimonas thermodepolymerans]RDI01618.1 LuxR family two component transcriptional regulator [Caldimonas thermodepolymerans]TCP04934.1 LuxR family two component transcriptional regulator [Caldimonas thermodepolymerans]UZG44656.1 response regulator transcription factor [Caldimonas thermodepolymerans